MEKDQHAAVTLTDGDFQSKVYESPLPVVVDFWAPWCGPCRSIAPIVEKLAAEYKGRVVVAKVNVDQNPAIFSELNLRGIPALIFYDGKKVVHQQVGFPGYNDLRKQFDRLLDLHGHSQATTDKVARAEEAFAIALEAADDAYEADTAAAQAAFDEATKPYLEAFNTARDAAQAEQSSGAINEAECERRITAAGESCRRDAAEHIAALKAVTEPAGAKREAAIQAATQVYLAALD